MSSILNFAGTIIKSAAKKVLGPVIIVCGCYTMILYVITRLFESQLRESNGKLRKVLRAISKPPLKVFTFLGGLPEFKIIGYGAAGVGVIALIGVIATNFSFNMLLPSLVLVAICAGGTAFGLFCILLACKGFAVALGYTMAVLGDEDTYIDTVRSIDGKFIVYDDEEESMYPEDLITHSNVTRAEAEAQHRRDTDERNRIYKEQREAHRRYLDAKSRYDSASYQYRSAMSRGATQDAMRFKADMDIALADMLRSGYKG